MKQLVKLLVIALALVFVGASCQKEGVYNPKQKIDRVYYSEEVITEEYDSYDGTWDREVETVLKYVKEVWHWDGNLLTSIDFYSQSGDLFYTENYSYDGKRLTRVSWGGSGYYDIAYDGNELSSISLMSGTTLETLFEFDHEGGKISEIEVTTYDSDDKADVALRSICRFFMPDMNSKCVDQFVAMAKKANETKESYTYKIGLEWIGNNVHRMVTDYGPYRYSTEFSYDSKLNPFYGMFDFDEFTFTDMFSKNNILSETSFYEDEIEEATYQYNYSGNYPTTKTQSSKYESSTYKRSTTSTYYYEYSK